MRALDQAVELLVDCFEVHELKAIARAIGGGSMGIEPEVDWQTSARQAADGLVAAVHRHGLDDALFGVVMWRRKARRADVQRVWQACSEQSAGRLIRGRFRLVKRLAKAATHDTWLAEDDDFGRKVVLRLYEPDDSQEAGEPDIARRPSDGVLARAAAAAQELVELVYGASEREARQCAHIEHMLAMPRDPYTGGACVVVPYFGQSLVEWVRGGSDDPCEALNAVADVAEALTFVHAQGLVHRSVQPKHIRVRGGDDGAGCDGSQRREGEAVLCDFMLAGEPGKLAPADDDLVLDSCWAWLAPEVRADPSAADSAADVYGLGATLFFAVTGKIPVDLHTLEWPEIKARIQGARGGCDLDEDELETVSTLVYQSTRAKEQRCGLHAFIAHHRGEPPAPAPQPTA